MPRILAALLLFAAALAIGKSASLGWGGAWGPNDTRYKVSPGGISHVLQPRQLVSATTDARWSPREEGERSLLAIGDRGAYARLKLVYPLLWAAVCAAAIGGVLLLFGKAPLVPLVPAALTIAAMALFVASARGALAVLNGTDFGFGGSLGAMLVSAAPLLCVLAIVVLTRPRLLPLVVLLGVAAWYVDVRLVDSWMIAAAPPLVLALAAAALTPRTSSSPPPALP